MTNLDDIMAKRREQALSQKANEIERTVDRLIDAGVVRNASLELAMFFKSWGFDVAMGGGSPINTGTIRVPKDYVLGPVTYKEALRQLPVSEQIKPDKPGMSGLEQLQTIQKLYDESTQQNKLCFCPCCGRSKDDEGLCANCDEEGLHS